MSGEHGEPPEGWECLVMMEDITLEDGNYVKYQCYPSLKWNLAKMEQSFIQRVLHDIGPPFSLKKDELTESYKGLQHVEDIGVVYNVTFPGASQNAHVLRRE